MQSTIDLQDTEPLLPTIAIDSGFVMNGTGNLAAYIETPYVRPFVWFSVPGGIMQVVGPLGEPTHCSSYPMQTIDMEGLSQSGPYEAGFHLVAMYTPDGGSAGWGDGGNITRVNGAEWPGEFNLESHPLTNEGIYHYRAEVELVIEQPSLATFSLVGHQEVHVDTRMEIEIESCIDLSLVPDVGTQGTVKFIDTVFLEPGNYTLRYSVDGASPSIRGAEAKLLTLAAPNLEAYLCPDCGSGQ